MAVEERIVPSIKIMISESFRDNDVLLEVLSGVEEESIPYELATLAANNAVELAYEGAISSVLETGIGIDSAGIVAVHTKSLPKGSPLFQINYNIKRDKVRAVSANAARLVKRIPFIL